MYGAIIGNIVGSRFEWNNIKTKDFEFFTNKCFYTDDSVMTIAVYDALKNVKVIIQNFPILQLSDFVITEENINVIMVLVFINGFGVMIHGLMVAGEMALLCE